MNNSKGIYISPSLLAADFCDLGNEVRKIEEAGADFLHLDVMDGVFVPNFSFGFPVISSLRARSSLIFDVHLMICDPEKYIDRFISAGADIVTFHFEAVKDPMPIISRIKNSGAKAGMAISPSTPVNDVLPYISEVDMILIMTVEPGFGGQKLIPETIEKVRFLRKQIEIREADVDIEVDGGITSDNLKSLTEAGANVIVAGSAIFGAQRPKQVINSMRTVAQQFPYLS